MTKRTVKKSKMKTSKKVTTKVQAKNKALYAVVDLKDFENCASKEIVPMTAYTSYQHAAFAQAQYMESDEDLRGMVVVEIKIMGPVSIKREVTIKN